jgi:hypothetical protein
MYFLDASSIQEITASGMEARQGGDADAAPPQSDDSPTAEGGDAQAK